MAVKLTKEIELRYKDRKLKSTTYMKQSSSFNPGKFKVKTKMLMLLRSQIDFQTYTWRHQGVSKYYVTVLAYNT